MFSDSQSKIQFIFGVLWTVALYLIGSLCFLIAVNTISTAADRPITQEISEVYTVRTPTGIQLNFVSTTNSPATQAVNLIRSLQEESTNSVILLPSVTALVNEGNMTLEVSVNMPTMNSGIWHYQRAFTYHPAWSINEKIATYPPITFRVCDEIGRECRLSDIRENSRVSG